MKKTMGLLTLLLLLFVFAVPMNTEASGTYSTSSAGSKIQDAEADARAINVDAGVPVKTMEDVEKWGEEKGFDVVHLLQKFIQPFAVIIFIVGIFLALTGTIGNSQLMGRGITAMFVSIIMYAGGMYATEILEITRNWLSS